LVFGSLKIDQRFVEPNLKSKEQTRNEWHALVTQMGLAHDSPVSVVRTTGKKWIIGGHYCYIRAHHHCGEILSNCLKQDNAIWRRLHLSQHGSWQWENTLRSTSGDLLSREVRTWGPFLHWSSVIKGTSLGIFFNFRRNLLPFKKVCLHRIYIFIPRIQLMQKSILFSTQGSCSPKINTIVSSLVQVEFSRLSSCWLRGTLKDWNLGARRRHRTPHIEVRVKTKNHHPTGFQLQPVTGLYLKVKSKCDVVVSKMFWFKLNAISLKL